MEMHSPKVFRVLAYAGVYVGAIIGAGYASGQEILQFFASYGLIGIIGAIITTLLFMWYGTVFMELGHRLKTNSHKVVCRYLCGNIFGTLADYILLFFMFGVITIMVSGGGAAMEQYYGWHPLIGKIIVAFITFITVFLGFSSAIKTLGFITPAIVIGVLIISMITIGDNYGKLSDLNATLISMNPEKASNYWWFAAIIYVSYNVVPSISIFASLGNSEKNTKVIRSAGILGGLTLGVCVLFITLAILSNLKEIMGYQIPFLEIAEQINYTSGLLFSILLLAAIYTTAVADLYAMCIRFFNSDTKKFRLMSFLVMIASILASMFPFSQLVGTVYPILGVLGLVIMGCAFYKTITGDIFSDKVEKNRIAMLTKE